MMDRYKAVTKLVTAMSVMHEEHNHHGANVATLARRLADALHLPHPQRDLVEVGAHLHDIGKLRISRDLLNIRRTFEPAEQAVVRRHAELGWAIVDQAGFEPMICEIVRHHHERYDGNGYPDGLQGDRIPLGARIVAICDVYAALVSPRTYRTAYTPAFAQSFVQAGKGAAFDPDLVDLFFRRVVLEV